jgi:hypothetical protein
MAVVDRMSWLASGCMAKRAPSIQFCGARLHELHVLFTAHSGGSARVLLEPLDH